MNYKTNFETIQNDPDKLVADETTILLQAPGERPIPCRLVDGVAAGTGYCQFLVLDGEHRGKRLNMQPMFDACHFWYEADFILDDGYLINGSEADLEVWNRCYPDRPADTAWPGDHVTDWHETGFYAVQLG